MKKNGGEKMSGERYYKGEISETMFKKKPFCLPEG